jgi:hypothetical protein
VKRQADTTKAMINIAAPSRVKASWFPSSPVSVFSSSRHLSSLISLLMTASVSSCPVRFYPLWTVHRSSNSVSSGKWQGTYTDTVIFCQWGVLRRTSIRGPDRVTGTDACLYGNPFDPHRIHVLPALKISYPLLWLVFMITARHHVVVVSAPASSATLTLMTPSRTFLRSTRMSRWSFSLQTPRM